MTFSSVIDRAVELAIAYGNSVSEISTGWSKVREVVHMKQPISMELRELLSADPLLRQWVTDPTPHNKGEIGFTDDLNQVAISFPEILYRSS